MDLTLAIEVLADEIKDKQRVIHSQIGIWAKEIEDAEEKIKEYRNKLEEEVYPLQIALNKLRELNTVCEKCGGIGLTKQYCIDTDSFEDDLCEDCKGIGDEKRLVHICACCNGTGKIFLPNSTEVPDVQLFLVCGKCKGSGVS